MLGPTVGQPQPMAMPQQPMGGLPTPPGPQSIPKEIGDLVSQIIGGFRAYRDVYWPSVQKFATQGGPRTPEEQKEELREAWYSFLDLLRDGFDRMPF